MGLTEQGSIAGRKIVRTQPGRATGEVIYTTEGGRRWTTEIPPGGETVTGVTIRNINCNN